MRSVLAGRCTSTCHPSQQTTVRIKVGCPATCQQVVSTDPTPNLRSHHGALSRNLSEQG
jgi:hypothetical protein